MSARRLAALGGISAFQQVVPEPPQERRTRLPLVAVPHALHSEARAAGADKLISEGLIGPKRADKAPARRRAEKLKC